MDDSGVKNLEIIHIAQLFEKHSKYPILFKFGRSVDMVLFEIGRQLVKSGFDRDSAQDYLREIQVIKTEIIRENDNIFLKVRLQEEGGEFRYLTPRRRLVTTILIEDFVRSTYWLTANIWRFRWKRLLPTLQFVKPLAVLESSHLVLQRMTRF